MKMNNFKRKYLFNHKCFAILLFLTLITLASVSQLSEAHLYGIFNIFTTDFNKDSLKYQNENKTLLRHFSTYESDLLSSKLKIFFIQTSTNSYIISRHACSIESAARLHSHGLIFVFLRSQYINLADNSFNYLFSYENIRFVHFNENDIYSGTTLSQLIGNKPKQFIDYFSISHMSDFVRTALLYKYGGIYLDLDVIVLKKLSSFTNTIALETNDDVNVAVMAFEKQHFILDIQMDIQISLAKKTINSFCWNCFGPLALTDALKNTCGQQHLPVNSKNECHQIDIQPSFVFYPINYQEIPTFFHQSKSSTEIDMLIKNSSIFSIHYFHHMTMNLPIHAFSKFARIAELYCPDISKQLINKNEPTSMKITGIKYFFVKIFLLFFCIIISFIYVILLILTGNFLLSVNSLRHICFRLQDQINIFP